MKVRVTTVKELKEILNKLPDYADVERVDLDDNIVKGVDVNYDEGTSWSNPYICIDM